MNLTSRPTPAGSTTLVSAFSIGQIVIFKPKILIDRFDQGVLAFITRISFDTGKVLYDLALYEGKNAIGSDLFYFEYPLQNVDSIFVHPLP